jgi:hypothetical protein
MATLAVGRVARILILRSPATGQWHLPAAGHRGIFHPAQIVSQSFVLSAVAAAAEAYSKHE